MTNATSEPSAATLSHSTESRWQTLASRVLDGQRITAEEATEILACPDEEVLDLMQAAYRVRRQYFGNSVQLYFLMNAKSGLCPEDCGYCSQSKVSEAEIPKLQPAQSRASCSTGPGWPPSAAPRPTAS